MRSVEQPRRRYRSACFIGANGFGMPQGQGNVVQAVHQALLEIVRADKTLEATFKADKKDADASRRRAQVARRRRPTAAAR